MSETLTITEHTNVFHVTVRFDDGESIDVASVYREDHGSHIDFYGIENAEWEVSQPKYSMEPNLACEVSVEDCYTVSLGAIKDVETRWVEELTAVARDVVERQGGFIFDRGYNILDESPDVELWERHEWDAHAEDVNTL